MSTMGHKHGSAAEGAFCLFRFFGLVLKASLSPLNIPEHIFSLSLGFPEIRECLPLTHVWHMIDISTRQSHSRFKLLLPFLPSLPHATTTATTTAALTQKNSKSNKALCLTDIRKRQRKEAGGTQEATWKFAEVMTLETTIRNIWNMNKCFNRACRLTARVQGS